MSLLVIPVSPHAMLLYGLGALVSMLFGFDPPIARVLLAQAAALIALIALIEAAPYVLSTCPRCGHNPTRRKDGGWMTLRMRDAKLRKLTECERCGATG